jgi:hypothetical protein
MSEENIKKPEEEGAGENAMAVSQPEPMELIVNKKTGEIIFKSRDGQVITAKATVIEKGDDDDDDGVEEVVIERQPLTPEQFREALQRLQDLGLRWTADQNISPIGEGNKDDNVLLSPEFKQFQNDYPTLPREVNTIAFHHLVGRECPADIVGEEEIYRKKLEIAKDFYLNDEYREAFFFKYAIKVPYFSEIDWEIVIKTAENNVRGFPGIAYALLSLHLNSPNRKVPNQLITVAVNTAIVDKLMASLENVKKTLVSSQALTRAMRVATEEANLEKVQDDNRKDSAEMVG